MLSLSDPVSPEPTPLPPYSCFSPPLKSKYSKTSFDEVRIANSFTLAFSCSDTEGAYLRRRAIENAGRVTKVSGCLFAIVSVFVFAVFAFVPLRHFEGKRVLQITSLLLVDAVLLAAWRLPKISQWAKLNIESIGSFVALVCMAAYFLGFITADRMYTHSYENACKSAGVTTFAQNFTHVELEVSYCDDVFKLMCERSYYLYTSQWIVYFLLVSLVVRVRAWHCVVIFIFTGVPFLVSYFAEVVASASTVQFIVLFLTFLLTHGVGSAVCVLTPRIVEKADRQRFLRDQRIKRLLADKDAKISKQSEQVDSMQKKLNEATLVVKRFMEEGGSAIAAYELRSADIDYGEVRHTLGEGAFGTVYRATFRGTHQIAVKTMRIAKINSRELQKFKSEIVIMAPLHHRSIVKLYGGVWNEGADHLCIVLEFCSRGSLTVFLEHKAGTWEGLHRRLAINVAEGLAYLHHDLKEPLLHRDVKPENILISGEVVAKLADFGESTNFDLVRAGQQGEDGEEDDALTMTLVGTHLYVAPEVLARRRYRKFAPTC